jgi:hypothetical protein
MGDMSLRQTLALSVLTTPESIARRSDAEERELWLNDLIKQSQVGRSHCCCYVMHRNRPRTGGAFGPPMQGTQFPIEKRKGSPCSRLRCRWQVTVIKDWRRWNWRVISWLLDGPLCNPTNLTDVLKTKFMSRIGKLFVLRPKKTNTASYVHAPVRLPSCPLRPLISHVCTSLSVPL